MHNFAFWVSHSCFSLYCHLDPRILKFIESKIMTSSQRQVTDSYRVEVHIEGMAMLTKLGKVPAEKLTNGVSFITFA